MKKPTRTQAAVLQALAGGKRIGTSRRPYAELRDPETGWSSCGIVGEPTFCALLLNGWIREEGERDEWSRSCTYTLTDLGRAALGAEERMP